MAEKNYSEDYEKLLIYKQNVSSENFSEIKLDTVEFFFSKYQESINNQYNFLKQLLSLGTTFEGTLDYEETKEFSLEIPPQEDFDEKIKEKYIPQALNSFNPEIITNKSDYNFITYLSFYFKHAVRDLASHWRKNMTNPGGTYNQPSTEEKIINEIEYERIREKITELKEELTPLESKVLGFLIDGKKQKDMILINEETGKPYTKGYVSKLVKKIRAKMRSLLKENARM